MNPNIITLYQIYADRRRYICSISNSFSPEIVEAERISLCPAFSKNNYTVLRIELIE